MLAIVLFGKYNVHPRRSTQYSTAVLMNNRVVFVIMIISSIAFYAMAYRVPVVSTDERLYIRPSPNRVLAKTSIPYLDCLHYYLCGHLLFLYGS